MEKIVLNVEGMSCNHCVNAVKGALAEFEGIANAEVDLEAKTATFEADLTKVSLDDVKAAIEDAGYDIV